MSARRWTYIVQDARARRHRGIVTWGPGEEAPHDPPEPPIEFQIALLTHPSNISSAAERTAICVPGVPRLRAIRPGDDVTLPRKIAELALPPHKMAEYAAGAIVMAAEGLIEPDDVFPSHSEHPRLDRLALTIVETAAAEATAPFIAIIRHELGLRPNADALAVLGERLAPSDPKARPASRAPGVLRLARALRRLRDGSAPADSLEQLSEDLRFLRLFEDEDTVLQRDALEQLLGDVMEEPARKKPDKQPAKIVPLRPKREPE